MNISYDEVGLVMKTIEIRWNIESPMKMVYLAIKFNLIKFVDTLLYFPELNITTSVFEPPKRPKQTDEFQDWVENNNMSVALANVLLVFHRKNFGVQIVDISKEDFRQTRGGGEVRWKEFEKLRSDVELE